jgi:hypothetical protein
MPCEDNNTALWLLLDNIAEVNQGILRVPSRLRMQVWRRSLSRHLSIPHSLNPEMP